MVCSLIHEYSGNEIGPFRAIEESIVAQLVVPESRSDLYAWYSLFGLAGSAFGLLICGWVLQYLTEVLSWDLLYSYRTIYAIYAAIGVLKLALTLFLSHSVESEKKQQQKYNIQGRDSETTPLLNGGLDDAQEVEVLPASKHRRGLRALLPDISKGSVSVVTILCFLFGLDAFGTGVNPL
jgi:MFS family permease